MRGDHTEHCGTDLDTLHEVTDAAADIFTAPPRWHAAKAYLRQRGIDPAGLGPSWIIGYAPPGWTRLVDKLQDRFDEQAVLDAGVARRSSRGTLIDTFRDRVVLGIRNGTNGKVAGFIGRDLSGGPNAPKYLNTHQHPLFDKSKLLFGLYEGALRTEGRQPVVVEGPLDVLAIASRANHDSAELIPVAACGTAFTPAQAHELAEVAFRHESPVLIAMDGDAPGRLAALAAGEHLRKRGLEVRITELPNGSDPAEYLMRRDATLDSFRVDNGVPLLTARVQNVIAAVGDGMQWIEGRLAALRNITGYLATYPPSYAAHQVSWLADVLDVAPFTVTNELVDAFRGRRDVDQEPARTRVLRL